LAPWTVKRPSSLEVVIMLKAKNMQIDVLVCKLDNLNQNNLRNGVIDKTTYDNYRLFIHEIWNQNSK